MTSFNIYFSLNIKHKSMFKPPKSTLASTPSVFCARPLNKIVDCIRLKVKFRLYYKKKTAIL